MAVVREYKLLLQVDVWHHHDQPPLPSLLFCESNNRISGVSRRTKKKSIKRKDGANSKIHQGWNHFICMFTPLTGGTLIKFHRDLEGRLVKFVTTSNLVKFVTTSNLGRPQIWSNFSSPQIQSLSVPVLPGRLSLTFTVSSTLPCTSSSFGNSPGGFVSTKV